MTQLQDGGWRKHLDNAYGLVIKALCYKAREIYVQTTSSKGEVEPGLPVPGWALWALGY